VPSAPFPVTDLLSKLSNSKLKSPCNCAVTPRFKRSSVVNLCKTLPSILALWKASLCCGNPISSSHRNTAALSIYEILKKIFILKEIFSSKLNLCGVEQFRSSGTPSSQLTGVTFQTKVNQPITNFFHTKFCERFRW
ncbi:hypothetical protein ALC53_13284, partial [Atta colombica]